MPAHILKKIRARARSRVRNVNLNQRKKGNDSITICLKLTMKTYNFITEKHREEEEEKMRVFCRCFIHSLLFVLLFILLLCILCVLVPLCDKNISSIASLRPSLSLCVKNGGVKVYGSNLLFGHWHWHGRVPDFFSGTGTGAHTLTKIVNSDTLMNLTFTESSTNNQL